MTKGYKGRYLLIIGLTAIISLIQIYVQGKEYSLINFLNPFLSQLLGPLIFAAFLTAIFWYLGREITPRRIFYTYLFFWALLLITNLVFISIYNEVLSM